ncbi:MAG: aspartate aminotransferase family protein [Spirochaetales bacterium]|nr:aspartate aminotransferase family protein [Spirochaetales bacterium]
MSVKETVALGQLNYMHNYAQFPISFSSGEGCYLIDEDGNRYLDCVAGIAVNDLGYGNEEVAKVLKDQIDTGLLHCSNLYYNANSVKAAAMLNKLAGSSEVFFCNSGTEANEAALKMARKYGSAKGKYKIISMEHSFHGRTYGSITVTGQEKYHKGFAPMLPGVLYATFNDLESVENLVDDKTCAIIVEPLQGEGGIVPAKQEFLSGLRALCDEKDIVLIFDEVQCGLGRTGRPFCFQHYGVKPDILTLAKAIGCGVPMGATLAFERVKGTFAPGDHAATFGGNLLATAASQVILSKLSDRDFLEDIALRSSYLEKKLDEIVAAHPDKCIERRGMGFMQGIDLKVAPRDVVSACMEKGLLVCSAGYTVLRFVPPLVISREEIDRACSIVEESLSSL